MFIRTLRMSEVNVWDTNLYDEITRPRNAFLYKAEFWPAVEDLVADGDAADFDPLLSAPLDPEETGFLLRLGCDVYRVFEQLSVFAGPRG